MALFSIEINDDDVVRVLTALASNYQRPEMIDNPNFNPNNPEDDQNPRQIENTESIAEFGNRIVRNFLEENCVSYEVREAKRIAAETARNNSRPSITDPQQ